MNIPKTKEEFKNIKIISKPDEWFDAGTEVTLIDLYDGAFEDCALFEGLHNGSIDQEICLWDEFILEERK